MANRRYPLGQDAFSSMSASASRDGTADQLLAGMFSDASPAALMTYSTNSIGTRLRRAATQGALGHPVMTSGAPTLTGGTTVPGGLTQSFVVSGGAMPAGIRINGGAIKFPYADTAAVLASWEGTGNAGNSGAPAGFTEWSHYGWTIDFETDAPLIDIVTDSGTTGWRVMVDGLYASTAPTALRASGGASHNSIDFGGVRQTRRIVFEAGQANRFYGLYIGPTDKIWMTNPADNIRALVISDSYGAGSGSTFSVDNFANLLGRGMGWATPITGSVGGSAIVISTGNKPTGRGRLANLLAMHGNVDVVVTALGTNDASDAGIQAEMQLHVAQVRANWPAAVHIVLGPWSKSTGPSATIITIEAAIAAAVTASGDGQTIYIPVSPAVSAAWVSGTGRVGATTGSGNSDRITGTDGTHPADFPAYDYLIRRAVMSMRLAIQALP